MVPSIGHPAPDLTKIPAELEAILDESSTEVLNSWTAVAMGCHVEVKGHKAYCGCPRQEHSHIDADEGRNGRIKPYSSQLGELDGNHLLQMLQWLSSKVTLAVRFRSNPAGRSMLLVTNRTPGGSLQQGWPKGSGFSLYLPVERLPEAVCKAIIILGIDEPQK